MKNQAFNPYLPENVYIPDGTYGARIACNLWSKDGTGRYDIKKPGKQFTDHPYFTQSTDRLGQTRQYLANMRGFSVAGFKYFEIKENTEIQLKIRGQAKGKIRISDDEKFENTIAEILVDMNSKAWVNTQKAAVKGSGVKALYFRFEGSGAIDFFVFHFSVKNNT